MSVARDTILRRVRSALRDVPPDEQPSDVVVTQSYRHQDDSPHHHIIGRFVDRVTDYKAHVRRVEADDLPGAIAEALKARGVQRLLVPADLPQEWFPSFVTPLRDSGDLSYELLDSTDGVLTCCALGVAQTGTIVLDHGALQGRRAITLVPDYHLCIVRADQVVGLMPEAIVQLEAAVRAGQPLTFISGPSATSDIELNRVEGVHGPRTLEVLLVSSTDG